MLVPPLKRGLRKLYYLTPLSNWAASRAIREFTPPFKLNCGSGMAPLKGWMNIDISFSAIADARWDFDKLPFPFKDASCSHIYCESVFQMLSPDQARRFLLECKRMLAPKGVMRIAMPSLEDVVSLYASGSCGNPARMINQAFQDNTWLYDWDELERVLGEAGFPTIRRTVWGESAFPELRNLETRPESKLICDIEPRPTLLADATAECQHTSSTENGMARSSADGEYDSKLEKKKTYIIPRR